MLCKDITKFIPNPPCHPFIYTTNTGYSALDRQFFKKQLKIGQ